MVNQIKEFRELSQKFGAVNNEVKLQIIALLTEKGALSITDISKELKLNFSTTHKYLEQLEKAGLLKSNTVLKNRLKRLFYVKDFHFEVSPRALVTTKRKSRAPKEDVKVIDKTGIVRSFDIKEILRKYLPMGVPLATIEQGAQILREKAYDGITTLELEEVFKEFLRSKVASLNSAINSITQLSPEKRTYADVLRLLHPEALEMHRNGDIFIENLNGPILLNFVHDIRGISIHGVNGKKPENLQELFKQTIEAINIAKKFTLSEHILESFNYFIAPFVKNTEHMLLLEKFLIDINKSANTKIFISIDLGLPRFASRILPDYIMENADIEYNKYQKTAEKIGIQLSKIIDKEKLSNIVLTYKLWDKKWLQNIKSAKGVFIANMIPDWQTLNAAYAGCKVRFDAEFKGWNRTVRTGQIQNITINLPRTALKSKSQEEFFSKLKYTLNNCCNFISTMAELTMGEFFKEYDLRLPSAQEQKKRWNYLHIEDCLYSISVTGLNETVGILSSQDMAANPELAEQILSSCNKYIAACKKAPFRIHLREETNSNLTKRFYSRDSMLYKLKLSNYSSGVSCKDSRISASMHKYLLGGHCVNISEKEFEKLIDSDFGLVYIS